MTDPRWLNEQAPSLIEHLLDTISIDEVHEWMESHHGRPFHRDDAITVLDAANDLWDEALVHYYLEPQMT